MTMQNLHNVRLLKVGCRGVVMWLLGCPGTCITNLIVFDRFLKCSLEFIFHIRNSNATHQCLKKYEHGDTFLIGF